MDYQNLTPFFPFTISTEDPVSAFVFGFSLLIILILIVMLVAKKIHNNEMLKYEFITIIAHKFRTPLTQVKWTVEEFKKTEQDPFKKQSLSEIEQSNEKLIKLTSALIELTDSDKGATTTYATERISIVSLVKNTGESFKDEFHKKNIFFAVQCPTDDFFVKVDTQRIEFVLQTLLENAFAYSTSGQNVEMVLEKRGHKAIISVTDHGIGIDRKDLHHLFTKFFRAKNAQTADTEGFGVGLYLSQAIIRRHHGTIKVDSGGIGTGATFTIALHTVK